MFSQRRQGGLYKLRLQRNRFRYRRQFGFHRLQLDYLTYCTSLTIISSCNFFIVIDSYAPPWLYLILILLDLTIYLFYQLLFGTRFPRYN